MTKAAAEALKVQSKAQRQIQVNLSIPMKVMKAQVVATRKSN